MTKENAGLSKVIVGLGWDEVQQKEGFCAKTAANRLRCISIFAEKREVD